MGQTPPKAPLIPKHPGKMYSATSPPGAEGIGPDLEDLEAAQLPNLCCCKGE